MTPKVPSSETGTTSDGTSVAIGLRRKANTTRITSMMAITSVVSTSCSEVRMVTERSTATSTSIELGIDARSSGRTSRTRSTVSMMLAPGWRLRTTSTAGRPLAIPALRRFSTESTTSPTSESRTGEPLR